MKVLLITLLSVSIISCFSNKHNHIAKNSYISAGMCKSKGSAIKSLGKYETIAICECEPQFHSHFEVISAQEFELNLSTKSKSYIIPSSEMQRKHGWPNKRIYLELTNIKGTEFTGYKTCGQLFKPNVYKWKSKERLLLNQGNTCDKGHELIIRRILKNNRKDLASALNDLIYIEAICPDNGGSNHGGVVHAEHGGSDN